MRGIKNIDCPQNFEEFDNLSPCVGEWVVTRVMKNDWLANTYGQITEVYNRNTFKVKLSNDSYFIMKRKELAFIKENISEEYLMTLSRKDLQKKAMELGVRANYKSSKIIKIIIDKNYNQSLFPRF